MEFRLNHDLITELGAAFPVLGFKRRRGDIVSTRSLLVVVHQRVIVANISSVGVLFLFRSLLACSPSAAESV